MAVKLFEKGDWEEGAQEVGEEHDPDCHAKSQVGGGLYNCQLMCVLIIRAGHTHLIKLSSQVEAVPQVLCCNWRKSLLG